jgi:putative intracellular protease/amidase
MAILMILTSHDTLGDTGQKTGFWLEEFAAPYYIFRDAGLEVVLATPQAGNRRWIRKVMRLMPKPRTPSAFAKTTPRSSPWRTRKTE